MALSTMLKVLTVVVLCGWSTQEPGPQYYPLPFGGHQTQQTQQGGQRPNAHHAQHQPWSQTNHNFTGQGVGLDPVSYPAAEEILRNDIPRQLYGVPPPPPQPFQPFQPSQGGGGASPYPQIYKLDNLIIIANPPQQQQACPPQRPPPDFPRPGPVDGLEDRFGGEQPSKCTWAIVACCSPGNNNVRYNCFELLGCPGFFFDASPCDPELVMAASKAALEFYSKGVNSTSSSGVDTNSV